MSSAGVFTLVSQDDTTDSYFTAYSYLENRLRGIYNTTGVLPTIADIEQSHILFVKSKYYPYVSIASEYAKVGGSNFVLGQTGPELSFTLPTFGDFTNDMVLHIRFNPVGNKTAYTSSATDPTAASTTTPLYRYCTYPGIRLLENVELRASGGVLIDSYQPEDVIAYKNFFVSRDHKAGWERCYGQDEIQTGAYNSRSFTGILNYSNGYQTPKMYHDYLDMFIPIHLWFCEDVSNALINYTTAASQRTIKIRMANLGSILQAMYYGPADAAAGVTSQDSLVVMPLPIKSHTFTASLYVNQLYTYPYIAEIMKREFNFNLIRVHKRQITGLSNPTDTLLLNQLHYPGEFLAVGFRNKNNVNDFDRWHLMGSDYLTADTYYRRTFYVPAIVWNLAFNVRQLVSRQVTPISSLNNIVSTIQITTNAGITIYPELPTSFFNDYLPIRYNKNSAVISPYDNNMFLITFCFYPGKFNPSGYFNFSTTREIHLTYALEQDYSNTYTNNYEVVMCMSALNFLYRQGDDLKLKYTM